MPIQLRALLQPPTAPLELSNGRCLLFAYGQLQPGPRQPRSMSRAWSDRVRGLLYDLGPFPATVKIGTGDQWLHGFVLEIDEDELIRVLDPHEEVGSGLYRRIRTVTEAGFEVWIYEYARSLPPEAVGPIERWPESEKRRRIESENE